ncbi:31654_t:CDS:2, partial [Gigaspora margarita]
LLSEHKESITKQEIANLIANEDFFTMCRLVHSVWKPIKEAIYALETNEATLADCFVYLIKLAIAIIHLPEMNTFKIPAISLRIFSINSTQANCEQNFSILKWILGDRQTSLDINKLEGMSKIKSYYTANIWHKLNFFDQTGANNETLLEDMFNNSTILLIGEVFDLETEKNSESFAVNTVQADSLDNLDYDPCDVLDNFLKREKQ